ncbi:MAG: hypothetical protein HQ450_01200, partial [Alcaligenaceae bacterium]|nr:hypothetical protein [Alcaligenaceae bacterium]
MMSRMGRPLGLRAALAGLCLCLPGFAYSQGAPLAPPGSSSTAAALTRPSSQEATLLRQIQQAARHLNYEGVFTFQ